MLSILSSIGQLVLSKNKFATTKKVLDRASYQALDIEQISFHMEWLEDGELRFRQLKNYDEDCELPESFPDVCLLQIYDCFTGTQPIQLRFLWQNQAEFWQIENTVIGEVCTATLSDLLGKRMTVKEVDLQKLKEWLLKLANNDNTRSVASYVLARQQIVAPGAKDLQALKRMICLGTRWIETDHLARLPKNGK